MPTSRLLVPFALIAVLAGCADDDPARLKVRGAATVALDGTSSGFDFADDVLLEDDRVGRYDRVAGHCVVSRGATGEPDILTVGLTVPDSAPVMGEGVRSIEIRVEGPGVAKVTAMMGETEFTGDAGATCTVTELYRRADEGVAGLEADCEIADATGRTAQASADLHFAGCSVL